MAVACWWLSCLFPSCILKLIWSKTSHFCSSNWTFLPQIFIPVLVWFWLLHFFLYECLLDSHPFTETLSDEASANGRWLNWKAKCICQDMTWFQILFICSKEIFRTAENTNTVGVYQRNSNKVSFNLSSLLNMLLYVDKTLAHPLST